MNKILDGSLMVTKYRLYKYKMEYKEFETIPAGRCWEGHICRRRTLSPLTPKSNNKSMIIFHYGNGLSYGLIESELKKVINYCEELGRKRDE